MKRFFIIFLFSCFAIIYACSSFGAERIVLYRTADTDADAWNLLKKYLAGKGISISTYEATDGIEGHVEKTNKINKEKAEFVIAVALAAGKKDMPIVAIPPSGKTTGIFPAIDEVSSLHENASQECATCIASAFNTKVVVMSVYPLVGINKPGVFVGIEYENIKKIGNIFKGLYLGIRECFERSKRHER